MDGRLQRRVQRYGWDRAAEHYERFWAEQLAPAQVLLLRMANLQAGERVLDVAAGTGLVTFPAAEAVGDSGEVLGTDISEAMVTALREEAGRRGLVQIRAERRDAEDLHVEPGAYDAALCALGLMYVPDPVAALREMGTALRPGGRCVAAVWGERKHCGWAEIFPIVDSRVQSDVCPMFFQLGTGDALALSMSQAGFRAIQVERIDTTLRYATAEDAIGAAFAGGPVALAYSRFDEETRLAAHEEYLASIAPYRTGTGYDIPGEFVVASGTRTG